MHILSRKHAFWRIDNPDRSRNATWAHGEKNNKNDTLGFDKLHIVGCVAQLAERRSLAGELTPSYARPAADGWPLCG